MTASDSNPSSPFTALVVDAAEDFREELVNLLLRLGFNVLGATDSFEEASELLDNNYCDLLITAVDLSETGEAEPALAGGAARRSARESRRSPSYKDAARPAPAQRGARQLVCKPRFW